MKDYEIQVDQNQMIEDFPILCYRDDKENRGLLFSGNLCKLGEKYGFAVQECDTQKYENGIDDLAFLNLFKGIKDRQTVLIATRKWKKKDGTITGEQHCLRFFRLNGDTKIFALEPKEGIERDFTFDDLRVFESWLYILMLKP